MKFICGVLTLINLSGEPWAISDMRSIVKSAETCNKKYKGCLKKFTKIKAKSYHAICKENKKK